VLELNPAHLADERFKRYAELLVEATGALRDHAGRPSRAQAPRTGLAMNTDAGSRWPAPGTVIVRFNTKSNRSGL